MNDKNKLSVLIVEDDEDIASLLVLYIERISSSIAIDGFRIFNNNCGGREMFIGHAVEQWQSCGFGGSGAKD